MNRFPIDSLLSLATRPVLDELTREPGPPAGSTIVVAVSGGGDSVALLHLLAALSGGRGWKLAVATLDHGLRAEAGAADCRFVQELCEQLSLPICAERHPIDPPPQGSAESAARRIRYAFLHRVAATHGAIAIALGHTQDDQAETLLYRLARGTGTLGAGAMHRWAPPLWRPLLRVRRERLRQFLRDANLPWREDATNSQRDAVRNRLRLDLLPALCDALDRDVTNALARAAELAQDDEALLESQAQAAAATVLIRSVEHEVVLDRKRLSQLPRALSRRILRASWRRLVGDESALDASHVAALLALARAESDGTHADLPAGWIARRCGADLWLGRNAKDDRS
ncbi:MAG: tRNA lysidine(34) synthetase TilS [Acidobacteriota bacterium]